MGPCESPPRPSEDARARAPGRTCERGRQIINAVVGVRQVLAQHVLRSFALVDFHSGTATPVPARTAWRLRPMPRVQLTDPPGYPGGWRPSCAIIDPWSTNPQCSTTWPSRTRKKSAPNTGICINGGGHSHYGALIGVGDPDDLGNELSFGQLHDDLQSHLGNGRPRGRAPRATPPNRSSGRWFARGSALGRDGLGGYEVGAAGAVDP